LEREINRLSGRLADSQFTSKAPSEVIDKEKSRLQEYQDKVARMKAELKQLG
jgi:valyl-tRNA synthetase